VTDLRILNRPRMTEYVVASDVLAKDDFILIDVGVSSGLDAHWRHFGKHLRAVGFDPWIDECRRLSDAEKNKNVSYVAALVGITDQTHWFHQKVPGEPGRNHREYGPDRIAMDPFVRSSAHKVGRASGRWEQPSAAMSSTKVQIDTFIRSSDLPHVDFIKIDTDGDDFESLLGCEGIIDSHQVLGFCLESQFHGPVSDRTNTWANIDRFLRSKGFLLFDTSMHRYSRATLPAPFETRIAAQTRFGQLMWGDALYFRDSGAPGYADYWSIHLAPEKLLKLACMFEIHCLPDCAADLIVAHREVLDRIIDTRTLLDFLTPSLNGRQVTYDEYMHAFETRLEQFFPAGFKTGSIDLTAPDESLKTDERVTILEAQLEVLKQAIVLKDATIASQNYSLERQQALYAELLRQQLGMPDEA